MKVAKIAVVIVLALLAIAWLAPRIESHNIDRAKSVAARHQIANFMMELGAYKQDVGHFPSTKAGLEALRTNPGEPNWRGPYLAQDIPDDPWGANYIYKYPGEHGTEPDIVSYGADRQPGGEGIDADIVSWKLR
jgi:general secretion pathway protein G